jgi:hypothetical protein
MHHAGGVVGVPWALLGAGLLWLSDWIHPPAPPPEPLLAALLALALAAFLAWLLVQAGGESYHEPIAAAWLAVVAPLLAAATGGPDGERARLAALSVPAMIPLLAPLAPKPGDVVLGRRAGFPWRAVRVRQADRFRHLLCIGPSGTGKTLTVLAPLLRQDLASGAGVIVLEPKDGELAEICRAVCRARGRPWREIAPLHPAGEPWNALQGSAPAAAERTLYALGRLQGGDRAQASAGAAYYDALGQSVLRHAVYAVKGALGDAATLGDLRELLRDPNARTRILARCDDAEVHRFFAGTFAAWRPDERARNVAGLLNGLDMLLAHPDVRRTLQPEPGTGVDLTRVLAEGGVLLVTVPSGELLRAGEALGAFFLAAVTAAVFARPPVPRPPVFLYVDEFQRFATPGFADFLAMARGYRVGAVLAHQNLAQLRAAGGQALVETVLANTRTRVVLACDAPDAAALAPALRCPPERLQTLPFGRAACLLPGGRTRFIRLPAPHPAPRRPQVAHLLWIRRTPVR